MIETLIRAKDDHTFRLNGEIYRWVQVCHHGYITKGSKFSTRVNRIVAYGHEDEAINTLRESLAAAA